MDNSLLNDINKNYERYLTQLEEINGRLLKQMLGETPINTDSEEREKIADLYYMFRELIETQVSKFELVNGKMAWFDDTGKDLTKMVKLESVACSAHVNYFELSKGKKIEDMTLRHSTISEDGDLNDLMIPLPDIIHRKKNNLDISGLYKQLIPYNGRPQGHFGFIKDLNTYISGFSQGQDNNRFEENSIALDNKKQELYGLIKETAESYTENPEKLAELFEFGSRFYNYSIKNTMLIQHQNPYATYVQSFQAWNAMDTYVKKGQKGLKILVPVKCTYLTIGDESIPLRKATKEQAAAYKQVKIKGEERLHFKVGTVFDISQTTFPKERYPELFSMGYSSGQHKEIIQGLTEFAKEKLDCSVITTDLQSISLRGDYSPFFNRIRLNTFLGDTEKLSTLSHELGHAMIHHIPDTKKTPSQLEFEADALSIMVQAHCGIEVTESRKHHLAGNYKTLLGTLEQNPDTKKDVVQQSQDIFSAVYGTFKENIDAMQQCIERHLPKEQALEQNETQNMSLGL